MYFIVKTETFGKILTIEGIQNLKMKVLFPNHNFSPIGHHTDNSY